MVRRLVEHEAVDAAGTEQREHRSRPLPRRQPADRPAHVVGAEPELGQQRAGVGDGHAGLGEEPVEERTGGIEPPPGLVELADHDGRPDPASPAVSGTSPSSAASKVVFPLPLVPMMARRSAQSTWRSTGPRRKAPRSTTAPSSRATTLPLRGASASSSRSSHPSQGLSTRSSRSSARSVRLASAERPSALAMAQRRMNLSLSSWVLHRTADACPRPRSLPASALFQLAAGARRRTRRPPPRVGGPRRAPPGRRASRRRSVSLGGRARPAPPRS